MFQKLFGLLVVFFCGCATTAKFDYRQNDMYMRGEVKQAEKIINIAADADVKRAKAYAIRQCAEDRKCLRQQQKKEDGGSNLERKRLLDLAEKALDGDPEEFKNP